jgi:hypothetical protein
MGSFTIINKMRIIFSIILLSLFHCQLFSQQPAENYLGSWYNFSLNHKLSERFSISPYAELRLYEPVTNFNLVFLSIHGNYHLNSKSILSVGYAFLDIDTVFEFDNLPDVKEHRINEQYLYKNTLGKFKIQHRFRLEQRFLELSNRNEIQNRFRYRLRLKYDINKTLFAALSEEPFINFENQAFHENRFYVGMGFKIIKNAQLQIGYLKQHIRKNNLNQIQIGISIQTDSRNPKSFYLAQQ